MRRLLSCLFQTGLPLVLLSSCGGGDPAQPQPTLVINLSPTSATLNQGDSISVTGTATAGGTFTGGVTASIVGWPTGLTASLGPIIPAGANSSVTLVLHVATDMPAGVYPLTIRASGSGITADATFTLTVVAVSTYGLAVAPDTITLPQGTSGNRNVTLSRINFTSAVTLSAENLPTGVTASFAPNPAPASASTLTLNVGASVTPGTYNLTIRGVATGLADRTDGLQLTVTAVAGPAYTIDATPDTVTIDQGANGVTTVSIARVNGHTAAVDFDLVSPPTGISGSFAPDPSSGASSTLTVGVGIGVAPGGYDLTIRGQDGVIAARTTTMHVIVTPAPAYTVDLTPDTITLEQSSQGKVAMAIARTNFTGAVTFSVLNAPAGVTSAFNANPTTASTDSLTLSVGSGVAVGTYNLTVRGVATGLTDRNVPLVLIVTVPVGFTIGSLADLTVQQGQSGQRKVVITRTGGFTGNVSFVVSTNNPELTASVSPTSTTGDTVTVTATASLVLPVSTWMVTVTASATGEPDVQRFMDVNVTAAPQSGNVILDFSMCTADQLPIWLAAQDGGGAWTRVTNVSNTFQFNVAQSTAGVAWATQNGAATRVQVMYLTQAEVLGNGYIDNCAAAPTGTTASFTLSNLYTTQGSEQFRISVGGGSASFASNGSGKTVPNVRLGTYDVVGLVSKPLVPDSQRVYIRRGQAIAASQNLGTIDVALANATNVALVDTATITIGNLGDDDPPFGSMEFLTGTASNMCLANTWQPSPTVVGNTFKAYGVPASKRVSTDFHQVGITSFDRGHQRTVSERFAALAARTVNLGAELPAPTITANAGPFKRLQAALTMPSEYNMLSSFWYVGGTKTAMVMATYGFFASTSQTLAMPDLSGVSGWDNNWVPAPSDVVSWFLVGQGSTGQCAEGARTVTSQVNGVQP
jgi:hypothetical protein